MWGERNERNSLVEEKLKRVLYLWWLFFCLGSCAHLGVPLSRATSPSKCTRVMDALVEVGLDVKSALVAFDTESMLHGGL